MAIIASYINIGSISAIVYILHAFTFQVLTERGVAARALAERLWFNSKLGPSLPTPSLPFLHFSSSL
jgi:hypothetical protein